MDQDDVKKRRNAERGMRDENQGADGGERSEFRIPNSEFEQSLSSLAPRAARLDRDRLMFLAGQATRQASGGRQPPDDLDRRVARADSPASRWGWPAAFSAMTALAASLLIMLVNRPEPQVIERIVRVPAAASPAIASRSAELGRQAIESEPPFSPAPGRPAFGESYLHARDQVLAFGLDSWMQSNPSRSSTAESAPTSYRELREKLFE
jgi:hypothetical protein